MHEHSISKDSPKVSVSSLNAAYVSKTSSKDG